MKSKLFKTLLGIAVAALFLFLALRGQPLDEIFEAILEVKIGYVLVAIFFYFLSYIARAEKWRIQVENLGFKLAPKTGFYAIMLHFMVNSFTIKLGGFVRCGNLKKTAKIPFPSCFGSYMSECVYDFSFMFLGLFIVLAIEFDKILKIYTNLIEDLGLEFLHKTNFLIISGIIGLLLFILFIYLYHKRIILKKYRSKIKEFIDSLKKTFNIKKFWLFIVWNIVLWIMLYLMNYFLFLGVFGEAKSFLFIYTITVFLYAAWLIPSPGGIGSVEYFVLQAFLLYGLSAESALAFGILSNALTLFSTLSFGLILIVIQNLTGVFTQEKQSALGNSQSSEDSQQ
jgi:glycosyltransferase 2 family protein